MNRTRNLVRLTVVGVAAMMALPAAALDLGPAGTNVWFVGEDFEGNLIVRQLPDTAEDHLGGCIGFSPLVNECSTGTHTPTGPLTPFNLLHGFLLICRPGGIPVQQVNCYVGRQTSTVSDGPHTRWFSCDILSPWQLPEVGIACQGRGAFPTTTFTHDCKSEGYGTVVPVAIGDWSCIMLRHGP